MIKTRAIAFFVLLGAVVIGYATYHYSTFKFGLDLAGGTQLVYQADVSHVAAADVGDRMNALQADIENRVNRFGVSEPIVQVQNAGIFASKGAENQLIVQLPGVTDVNAAIANIGATPVLEFRLLSATTSRAISASTTMTDDQKNTATEAAFQTTGLDGNLVKSAALVFDPTTNAPLVSLTFNSQGSDLFASTTRNNIGAILGIFLNGQAISLPVIQEPILTGTAQISGNFTVAAAQDLVRNLNYGALPVPITLISTQTIGASFGQAALNADELAGAIAFIIIAIFLIVWYRLPGVIAVLALLCYVVVSLAIFKVGVSTAMFVFVPFFIILAVTVHRSFLIGIPLSYIFLMLIPGALTPVTLTAEGIGGFILSIGMAVDANILIFERTKEELRKGSSISVALHEGFARAWPSIRDSNTSSIITGIILYFFGSTSVITGFALVFVIGVGVSMFTAITASRMFLFAIAPKGTGRFARFIFSNGFHFRKASASAVTPNNK